MSRDLVLLRTETNTEAPEELEDTLPFSLTEFVAAAKKLFPRCEYNSLSLDDEDFVIETNFEEEETTESILLHVRFGNSGAEVVLRALRGLCEALACRALDCGDGSWVDFEEEGEQ